MIDNTPPASQSRLTPEPDAGLPPYPAPGDRAGWAAWWATWREAYREARASSGLTPPHNPAVCGLDPRLCPGCAAVTPAPAPAVPCFSDPARDRRRRKLLDLLGDDIDDRARHVVATDLPEALAVLMERRAGNE
jgi:hypothetical protein